MTASPALENLLRLATRVVPGLCGAIASATDDSGDARDPLDRETAVTHRLPATDNDRNRAAIDALLSHWTSRYPEAGRAYWSLRCWGILIWQPIYLSVIGAHTTQRVLSLAHIEQPIENGWTREVRVAAHEPAPSTEHALIELAAREIANCCAPMFDELSRVIRVNPIAAQSMQADCVLAALLAVRATHPDWTDAQVESLGARWLAALSLDGRSGFFAYTRNDGASALALDRQTCCYHYRRRDGELCSTCPRLQQCERIARLNAEHDASAAAA